MQSNFDLDDWWKNVGISDVTEKLAVRKWCEKERLNSFESLLSFEPHRDCQGDVSVRDLSVPFCVGWKTALQTAVSGLKNNGKRILTHTYLKRIPIIHQFTFTFRLAQALHLLNPMSVYVIIKFPLLTLIYIFSYDTPRIMILCLYVRIILT
jgi:hypothetical protein